MSQDRVLKFKSAINRRGEVLGELAYEGFLSPRDEHLNCLHHYGEDNRGWPLR